LCKTGKIAILCKFQQDILQNMLIRSKENTFTARFIGSEESVFLKGITLLEILEYIRLPNPETIVLAKLNNRIFNLREAVEEDCFIEWVPLQSREGLQSYQQTLSLVLFRAFHELYPQQKLIIGYTTFNGICVELLGGMRVSRRMLKKLRAQMEEIIQNDEPIEPINLLRNQALVYFKEQDERPPYPLENQDQSKITLYRCGEVEEYLGYPPFHSARYVKTFDILRKRPGFFLRSPESQEIRQFTPVVKQNKLFRVHGEYARWKRTLDIQDVSAVNDTVRNGYALDMVQIAEGLHEKKILRIADTLLRKRKRLRIVLVVGPSASGRATLTRRLEIHLRVNGMKPVVLSLDDYVLDTESAIDDTTDDFESAYSKVVDASHLNHVVDNLLAGQKVQVPQYDPRQKKRIPGPTKILERHQPILIEGGYDLFHRIGRKIPKSRRLHIYVDALTPLRITRHCRVDAGDIGLIRRLIRNHYLRGISVADTIMFWPSVVHKDKKEVAPLLQKCNEVFNSSLVYELCVLRVKGESVLRAVPQDHPSFPEAQRLLQVLSYFAPIPLYTVPSYSILREFMGETRFDKRLDTEEQSK